MSQYILEFPVAPNFSGAQFHVTGSNCLAVEVIDRWPDWAGGIQLLVGPAGSGKSHLAEVWRARSDAIRLEGVLDIDAVIAAAPSAMLLDDAETAETTEADFFHLLNWTRESGASLLITAKQPPARWRVRLPDLASRLKALPLVAIEAPDDDLLAALLAKQFADRQIEVDPAVIDYLLPRIERSFDGAGKVVAALDAEALRLKRPITVPLAKSIVMRPSHNDHTG